MLEYQQVRNYTTAEIEEALERSLPHELQVVIIGAALYHEDAAYVERLCCDLADSSHEELRGNAILGLGHLARRFQSLDEQRTRPLIESGLIDPSVYVRGQAFAAADDAAHFLGWTIQGLEAE
jgi:hypothetical protein